MLGVTASRRGDTGIVAFTGRLDAAGAPGAGEAVRGVLALGVKNLLFDLRGLEYISSAGLQVVLLAARRTEASGGKLVLCGAGEYVLEVLKVTGFASFLNLESDCDEALERL